MRRAAGSGGGGAAEVVWGLRLSAPNRRSAGNGGCMLITRTSTLARLGTSLAARILIVVGSLLTIFSLSILTSGRVHALSYIHATTETHTGAVAGQSVSRGASYASLNRAVDATSVPAAVMPVAQATATAAIVRAPTPTTPQSASPAINITSMVASDRFLRGAADGWGNADLGGAWTIAGTPPSWGVNIVGGRVVAQPNRAERASLGQVAVQDVELVQQVTLPRSSQNNNVLAYLLMRHTGGASAASYYRVGIGQGLGRSTMVIRAQRSDGANLAPDLDTGIAAADAASVWLRVQAVGVNPTRIRARAWLNGTPEPTSWLLDTTDSNAAEQVAGGVGFRERNEDTGAAHAFVVRSFSAGSPTSSVPAATPTGIATPTATFTPKPPATATPTNTPGSAAPNPTNTPTPTPTPVTPPSGAAGFVTANGAQLSVNGAAFRFIGVNRYNLLTISSPYRGCGAGFSLAELDAWFAELHTFGPRVAVRFWAFQEFTQSGADFSRLDAVVALAQKYNIDLIPVFENQWKDCTPEGYKYDTWYASSYTQPFGGDPISYLDYIGRIVPRYRDNPQILAWQLINEAENKTSGGSCGNFASFDAFAANVSDYVRSLDPNHLISFGTMGSGQCGAGTSTQFRQLHSHPNVSIVEAHDYDHDSQAAPSYISNDLSISQSLNKPFFVGEGGIQAGTSCKSLTQRATEFSAKMTAVYSGGGDGYLIWVYHDPRQAPQSCNYDFLFDDPLVSTIRSLAP